jgi:hypothetical protein
MLPRVRVLTPPTPTFGQAVAETRSNPLPNPLPNLLYVGPFGFGVTDGKDQHVA